MLFQVLLTCGFTTLLVHAHRLPKSVDVQPRMGYSSAVIHAYPESKDLHSESSVKVTFQPQQGVPIQNGRSRGALKYLQTTNNVPNNKFYTSTIFDSSPKDSDSFNVGYNITFSNSNNGVKNKKPVYTRAHNVKLENAEVITGKSKQNEKVRAPSISSDLSPQDFVSHAFLKQKQLNLESLRHNSSPVGTQSSSNSVKYLNPIREYASKIPSQSPKFTYNVQQNIFKDVTKATKPDPIQLGPEFKTSYQTSSLWKNVSPGLEIGKSIEPQVSEQNYDTNYNARHTNGKAARSEHPKNFNHDRALSNSQSFDFSNAHGEILYGDNDNIPEGSARNYQVYESPTNRYNVEGNTNNQQFSDLNNINIEAHIPARLRGVKPLPLDTSLLKDAVLVTDFREPPKDSKVLPIHFDISNIQSVMKNRLSQIQSYAVQQNNHLSNPSQNSGLSYEDHNPMASHNDLRIYGKPEPVDSNQYRMVYNGYDREGIHFDNDIYKIVSMRPPPVGQNVKF